YSIATDHGSLDVHSSPTRRSSDLLRGNMQPDMAKIVRRRHAMVRQLIDVEGELRAHMLVFAVGKDEHVRTEFAFDIDELAHHRMAPAHYLRHIGLHVPTQQIGRASCRGRVYV